jgi:cell wall-associated NlpC family hydrolase
MASSLKPVRRRAVTGRLALLSLVAASGIALTALPAAATPENPTSSAEVTQLIAARAHDLEVVTEQFNTAREALATQQAAAQQAAAQVAAADGVVAAAREHVRDVARSAFTGDQLSTLQAMLTSSSADELLDRVGTLDTIAQHGNQVLAVAQQATEAAARAKVAADQATAAAQAQLDDVTRQQAALQSQIDRYQADFARLSAGEQQRAQELAEQHALSATAADLADRSAPAASRNAQRAPVPAQAAVAPVPPASGAAGGVVAAALAQVGDPYVWAASGPNAFDCSGLMQFAYRSAGVSLPHSSSMQSTMGRAVPLSALQPGDLLFFYSPVSHVAMYIGNGQMVHASTSGQPVKVASMNGMGDQPFARRLVG